MAKIFISGKITDNPNYIEEFKLAEQYLKNEFKYYDIVNPCEPEGLDYRYYIDIGLTKLMHCQVICMLHNWQDSNGACLEHKYAETVGMRIIYLEDIAKNL